MRVRGKILNVDDTAALLYSKSRLLRQAGHEVIEATTGAEALRLAREELPQVVVLDVNLPDMSGIEVCRRLKADPATRNIAVVQVSATFITDEDAEKSLENGADIYITEPFEPRELETVINVLLRLRRTEAGLRESETRWRRFVDANVVGVVVLENGRFIEANDMFLKLLGYSREELLSGEVTWEDLTPPEHRERGEQAYQELLEKGSITPFEKQYVTRSGDRVSVMVGSAALDVEQKRWVSFVVDITERKRAQTEVEQALQRERASRAHAEEATRLKDEFLANLSHELRTPMNIIIGWAHLLRIGALSGEQQTRAVEAIERAARSQAQLIEDLLDVSRIVTGKITLELSAVNPRRIIEAALETMRPAAQAKGIKIVPLLDTGVGTLRGDFARLQQVVCNLLSNAIKFTPTGGQVEVCLAQRNGEVEISVRDNGQGIKPEFLPYVFDRFRQEDGSISRCHGGLGLGLAIVRHLVELHGGTVEAASPGVGKGATFTVRLPVRAHTAPGRTETAPTVRPSNPSLLAGLHVLVVDDDPHARELMSCILEGFGARVSLAESGAAALTQLFAHRPDALVADLGMPGMDGYALIEQIRALDPDFGGRTPAVAVTACASAQDRLRALEAGYQNHIAKPVEPEELAVVIASLTGRCVPERRAQAD